MTTPAIRIESVSKQYRLGTVGTGTLAHDLNRWWHAIRGKEDPYSKVGQVNKRDLAADSEYVWALKDVNLEVQQGEVLGIIGANGAGKSTLLKIISRITSPTSGTIKAKGRVASLLEVGTGMHPEMTARENVYLNGAILGMRRHEIAAKFDDMINFAGCRMFVDTPVKRFSSGMMVRLGFAVAAFLDPEVLIVDEVLAVGDAEFQSRALGKMQEVTSSGRTILFVSHSMGAIQRLCPRSVIMHRGGVHAIGETTEMISKYQSLGKSRSYAWEDNNIDDHESAITSVKLTTQDGAPIKHLTTADTVHIELKCRVTQSLSDTRIAVALNDRYGNPVFSAMPTDSGCNHPTSCGHHRYHLRLPGPILRSQQYSITAALYSRSRLINHKLSDVLVFTPEDANSANLKTDTDRVGTLQLPCDWTHQLDLAATRNGPH